MSEGNKYKLCFEAGCNYEGTLKDFHDPYCVGEFYCPEHLEQNQVGMGVDDLHTEVPIQCDCEQLLTNHVEYFQLLMQYKKDMIKDMQDLEDRKYVGSCNIF